ncbi:hypothetical protein Q5P01_004291 [Channa striata]|uniref:Carrier domain-containing protein n=1 Tax=Channa striata TaxID=64152 RepID=A0AA88NNY8_CHASR|nr:hypothetical protein Q5P01_004291 [Channa striata]
MEEAEDGIAVVGIGCNFPGGEGLDNFWKVLLNGRNCSVPIPKERFDLSCWYDPDDNKPGKSRTAKAALIDGFNDFDHKFFGISDSEVEQMDPQQKQLLQCVYRALENAGIPMEKASGTRTGVFLGLMNRDYETNAAHVHPSVINHWTGTGLAMSIAANRASYIFNFTGPSLSVDCACSSSLVALHLACQSIKQGDCDMAVCGGVSCIIEPRVFVALSKAKMISPEGTSKPFSIRADGYGRGEGCGVVLLKPLKKAIQDHDNIWGVISKTAVNQDGHSVTPITKPSMTQQEELLRRMYSESDIANVQYIEAHGTGTPVGDPTEARSISNVIAKARPHGSETLRVGSVKSNIGHTESAAGVAGLIKVLLMMKHETIVPSLFYTEDTASVDAKALNIRIPKEAEKWKTSAARIAGVNNFGFGGTNAHAIVKQHKHLNIRQQIDEKQPKYFVMSANSTKSLSLMLEDTVKQLDAHSDVDLDSLLYTSACRRSHRRHKYRKAIRVSSVLDLKEKLSAAIGKNISLAYSDPKLVFVFCGNGTTYHGMCRELLKHEPVFRNKIEEIAQLFQRLSTLNILDSLESESESGDLKNPDVAQPLLFAVQVGIYTLLRHWGVKPDAVLGHSVGEVGAAHCSGLVSLEDAVKVIYFRSILQSKVTGGKMLVVSNMPVSEVTLLLPHYSGRITLAAFNSPQSCTLSGDAGAIESLHKELSISANSQNLFLRVLDVPAAYHSPMMDPVLPEIRETIGSLKMNDLDTELFSTVTGKEFQQGDFCTGEYWARNIREPVAFEQAVMLAVKGMKNSVFVEIGPRRALQRNIMECLGNDTAVLASVQPEKDQETILSVVPKLFELGVQIDWNSFYKGYETIPLPFPKYQFDCSDRDVIIGAAQNNTASNHPVICQTGSESSVFSCALKSDSCFYLKEHKHNEIPIIPGAFYAELGLATFMANAKPKVPLSSLQLSVSFRSPFVLTENSPEMKVKLEQSESETSFTVFSPSAVYASGTVVSNKNRRIEEQCISLSSIYKRCQSVVSHQEFYGYLSQGGFQYGGIFQNKADVHYGEDLREAFAVVTVQKDLRSQLHDYCIHPVVLDFFMQLLPVTVEHIFAGRPGFPAKIGSLTVFEPLQDEMVVYLRATDVGNDHFDVCGCFADKEGRVLVEVKHVIIKYLGSRSHVVEEYFYHNSFTVIPESLISAPPHTALVFCDRIGIGKGLQQHLDSSKYPELVVKDGLILKPSIVRTPPEVPDISESSFTYTASERCVLQTADAHNVTRLSAVHFDEEAQPIGDTSVELKPRNKVRVPENVCYNTKQFPFLQKTPCVSYFVLAWEILHRALPQAKHHLGIISSGPHSSLVKVLALTSYKSGWNVFVSTLSNDHFLHANRISALIVLPPFDESLIAKISKFPGVQDVVIICDFQMQGVLTQQLFQSVKEGVCIQTIQMPAVLQKGSLIAKRSHIHQWLKSLSLSRKFTLESFTFQSMKSETIKSLHSENPPSYFNTKKLAVVALERDFKSSVSEIPLLPTKKQLFRKRAVYIVAGGLSGLGFETVKFISQRGGEHVVILSRSKPTPDVQQEIHNVEKQCGNSITSMECDISVSEHVNKVISVIGQKFPDCPIRGVFHSAVVLHDGLIETLNQSLYEKVLKPKVNGALNLHHATQHCQLDYFVCYSSISAFLGNASQTNYAAANSFLDMFCQYRRKLGLPAQSINWGALNLGLLLNKEHFHRFLEAKGMMVLNVAEIHQSLEQCLVLNRPQQAVCRFHFRNIRYNILSQNAALTMRLSALVEEAFQKSKETDSQSKQGDCVSPKDYVISLLCETIGTDQSELKDESPLSSLGIDSMQAMTLQNMIFQERGVNVPLVKLLDPNATVSTVVNMLSEGGEGEDFRNNSEEVVNDVLTRL